MHPLNTYSLTGLKPVESNAGVGVASPVEVGAQADVSAGVGGILHPDNAMLWLGLILATTFGLVGVSGSLRVGNARASATLDRDS